MSAATAGGAALPALPPDLRILCIRHGTSLHNRRVDEEGDAVLQLPELTDTPLLEEGLAEAADLGRRWAAIGDLASLAAASLQECARETVDGLPSSVALADVDIVLVSPLQRTVHTAVSIFKHRQRALAARGVLTAPPLKLVLLDDLKEWSQGLLYPNRRRDLAGLKELCLRLLREAGGHGPVFERPFQVLDGGAALQGASLVAPGLGLEIVQALRGTGGDFAGLHSDADEMWRTDRRESIPELHGRIEAFRAWLATGHARRWLAADTGGGAGKGGNKEILNVAVVDHSSYLRNMLFGVTDETGGVPLKHCWVYEWWNF